MKMRRMVILGGAAALLAVGGCGDSAPEEARAEAKLVVGMELTYPPFETLDAEGNPDGVGFRIAEALATDLGRELVVENIQFDGLIPALKTGKIDLILSSMTANEKRAQSIDFSDPYVKTRLGLLVPADSDVVRVDDLNAAGRKIAVKLGTTGELYAKEHLTEADVVVLDSQDVCVTEVIQARVDAFIYDQLSLLAYEQEFADKTKSVMEPFQEESWAVGLKKGNDGLRGEVNAFLKKFREAGGFDDLAERYMQKEKALCEAKGVPFIF